MLRILVADSDPAVGNTLSRYFADQGHLVQVEDNPYLVEARSHSFKPDITFYDLSMALRVGTDILTGIMESGMRSRTVFMSNLRDPEHLRRLKAMDALSILPKPFDYDKIERLLSMLERPKSLPAAQAA